MAEKLNIPTDPAELATLVDEVAGLLADMAKSEAKSDEAQKLAKSEEESMAKEETPAPEDTAGPEDSSPAPQESAPAEEPAPQEEAPPAEEPAPEGQDMSVEDLAAMYQQLSPEQLEMHKQAIAMVEQQGQAPAEAPAASPSPSPSPAPEMAMKSEAKIQELEAKLSKALDEISAAREEANKAQAMTVEVLEKMAAPKSKAITGITFHKFVPVEAEKPLRKNLAEMTSVEIKAELAEIVKSPKLTKADREIINDYCLYPGRVSVDKLEKFFNK